MHRAFLDVSKSPPLDAVNPHPYSHCVMIRFLLTLLVLMSGLAAEGGSAQAHVLARVGVTQGAGAQPTGQRFVRQGQHLAVRPAAWLVLADRPDGRKETGRLPA